MSSIDRDGGMSVQVNSNSEDNGVELEHRDSTVAQLRRLASKADYKKSVPDSPRSEEDDVINDIRVSAAGEAANKIQDILKRQSESHADIRRFIEKEFHKSSAMKELVRHLIFLVVLLAGVTLHRSVYESYLLNQALLTAFVTQQIDYNLQPFAKTFTDIGQPDEFSDWFTSVLGGTLDQTTFYNGDSMTTAQENYVMFSNRLIGGVRIRQLRVAEGRGCSTPHQLMELSNGTCYAYDYLSSTRDTKPFGPPESPDRYVYQTADETGSVGFFGYILDYLDGGGYVVDLNIADKLNGTNYTEGIQQLVTDMFVDRQTRAIIISMIFANLELESRIGVMYLVVEIPGNGEFNPNYMIKTFRLDMYVTAVDYFRLCLEIIFVLFVLYAIYCEIYEMVGGFRKNRLKGLKKYFYNGWNILELVDIGLYVAVIVLYAKYLAAPERYNAKLDSLEYSSDMERLAAIALNFYNLMGFNVILTTFRTFKFLKLNHRLYLLWKTLRHAGMDLVGFLFIFLIFIFGFIFMGWLSFGADLAEFNTFVHSFATCWNFIIGNAPDYDSMYASNRVLGPTFFVLFTIFIFFILANMFIAILSNSFEVVNENTKESAKLKDIFEEKINEMGMALKKFFFIVTKRDQRRRPITELLDNLAHPEILDKPVITRGDIAKAIGDGATEIEIDDLHSYVKKLEAKKSKRKSGAGGGTLGRNSGPVESFEEQEDEKETVKPLMLKKSTPDVPPPSTPRSLFASDQETRAAIREMQAQIMDLKQLVHRLVQQKENKND